MRENNKVILGMLLVVLLITIIIVLSIKGFSQNMDIVSSNLCGEDTDPDIIDYKFKRYQDVYGKWYTKLKVKCNPDFYYNTLLVSHL